MEGELATGYLKSSRQKTKAQGTTAQHWEVKPDLKTAIKVYHSHHSWLSSVNRPWENRSSWIKDSFRSFFRHNHTIYGLFRARNLFPSAGSVITFRTGIFNIRSSVRCTLIAAENCCFKNKELITKAESSGVKLLNFITSQTRKPQQSGATRPFKVPVNWYQENLDFPYFQGLKTIL